MSNSTFDQVKDNLKGVYIAGAIAAKVLGDPIPDIKEIYSDYRSYERNRQEQSTVKKEEGTAQTGTP